MKIAQPTWSGRFWEVAAGGGGNAWDSFAYDPELNMVYIGTGNGSPHMWHFRSQDKGDNLFLCSMVAVDATTGEYKWHYQMVPEEDWDFTCTQPIVLADMKIEGKLRKVAMQALSLTAREDQIVGLLLEGRTNREIASDLGLTERTVKHYMTVLMQKLNVRNRVEVAMAAQNLRRTPTTRQNRALGGTGGLIVTDSSFNVREDSPWPPRLSS